jgi:hypothetical protein
MLPALAPSVGLGRTEVARVLGTGARVVLKLSETTGGVKAGALDDSTGATMGVGSVVLLPAEVVLAPATAVGEAGAAAAVELAGVAALEEEAGLEAPPPVAGEPEILPKVRS